MPVAEKLALGAAWLLILVFAAGLKLLPSRYLMPLLGEQVGPDPRIPLVDAAAEARARLVKRAVRRAARLSPWRSDCLPQALAGATLCRWLGVATTAFLGLRRGKAKPLEAHAWLCAGPVPVTGGLSFAEYPVVMCFARPNHAGTR